MILIELLKSISDLDASYSVVDAFLKENRPRSFVNNNRLSACYDDLRGSAHSLVDSYKAVLPWRYEEHLFMQDFLNSWPNLGTDIILKQLHGEQLSELEIGMLAVREAVLLQRMQREAVIEKERERTGYNSQAEMAERTFVSCFKAFIYFTRDCQNAIYSCLLETAQSPTPSRPDMKRILDPQGTPKFSNHVAARLEPIIGYFDWFTKISRLRNEIKDGNRFNKSGTPPNVGMNIQTISNEGEGTVNAQAGIHISDVVKCLQMSSDAMKRILI